MTSIFCDGGTNFLGGRNQLERDLLSMTDSRLKNYLKEKKIEFKVNTPTASHQGEIWERQIRTIRSIFNSIAGKYKGRMNTESLRTAFTDVMSAINNRPLSVDVLNDEEPLITANRLLTSKANFNPPPPGEFDSEEIYGRQMYRESQQLANEFWEAFQAQYLTKIERRSRWESPKPSLKVGDIVLIMDDNDHRNYWKTGRVIAVHKGADNLVRKARVMVGKTDLDKAGRGKERSVLERPIQKLVLSMAR